MKSRQGGKKFFWNLSDMYNHCIPFWQKAKVGMWGSSLPRFPPEGSAAQKGVGPFAAFVSGERQIAVDFENATVALHMQFPSRKPLFKFLA